MRVGAWVVVVCRAVHWAEVERTRKTWIPSTLGWA